METKQDFIIPGAGHGLVKLDQGDQLCITNIEGSQVVDLWAFADPDLTEYLSTEHTRSCLQRLIPQTGDMLYSNLRRPILTITNDTSLGVHDMLLSACDEQRYTLLGHTGYHKNCADNLRDALELAGHTISDIPSPFNVFENVTIAPNGDLSIAPPVVKAGQSITLCAQQPVIIVMSCCPMDIALTNGPDKRSKPVKVEVSRPKTMG